MEEDLCEIVAVLDPIALRGRWRSTLALGDDSTFASSPFADHLDGSYGLEIIEVTSPPPWNIAFSKRFKKDLDGLDRKLAGRVLEVLLEVKDFALPFVAKGDTFKALTGELAGCWRYRIGDHRLVLKPAPEAGQIAAIAFAARGSVYD